MQYSYRQLAERISAEIERGHYRPGARLPSLRSVSEQHSVSISTALRCYRYLETRGVVEARAKSGMYVADRGRVDLRLPVTAVVARAPVAYDKLVSLQHRLTELYSLTEQDLPLALHLASAAPDWYPCAALAEIARRQLQRHPTRLGQYPTGTGWPALKQVLLKHLGDCGVDLQPAELLITNGSTEALSVALRAVAQAGETVIVESPVYFGLLQMLENLGLRALEIPCTVAGGLSLEALEYALEHHEGVRAMVVMPAFQNPLGSAMSDKNKKRLLRLAEQYDISVIEDDVFGDITPHQERPTPLKAWDRQGRVIYCGSCSKSVAPAYRLGWVAGGRHHSRIVSLKLSHSLVTPWFEQVVLAEFLQSGALYSHLRKLRERLAANIARAVTVVAHSFPRGSTLVSTAGGWWLWLELPPTIDCLALLRRAVAEGIAFTPGIVFSHTSKYAHCLRLNIARPWSAELERGIVRLGELAQQFV
ncbi:MULTISPECIES: PLP-dependent aminotransferase family protein [unclassified Undibacterium]|uniref:aminotransferase-like domain-containing protein n=1 Tax=unclassified Undibacterium TaxID=2630295 RepID=UPI002AC9F085|nr:MULTISPECIES: PLP-dependent aminotransferase family protein [unclassified Undibacterium]MEB0137690.1 PLP-dependent aminotransferase family protein [Undibacterium sp. CCC2.1]MEB0172658.1 PLP-dependent aminotransferase family protein [Undibacterium sp. CCC1.1]MEB0177591.1 PLP-dependent aminotransferase family protein [Undibacterium sp. CCC3.4]MEB0215453.1 PLP-dependent aminotransferase family protein [Undibacterium sp. 5I2]WPX42264.1 PLP-dependent aminotransferase family protein [Undibacteriu